MTGMKVGVEPKPADLTELALIMHSFVPTEFYLTEKIDSCHKARDEARVSNSEDLHSNGPFLRGGGRPVNLRDTNATRASIRTMGMYRQEQTTYTTMNTAVKMEAKPIHVRMASFPRVWILASSAVHAAATKVQTTMQTWRLERTWNPCASPMNPDPVAKLISFISHHVHQDSSNDGDFDSHPRQEEEGAGNVTRNGPAKDLSRVGDVVDTGVAHAKGVHDVGVV